MQTLNCLEKNTAAYFSDVEIEISETRPQEHKLWRGRSDYIDHTDI